MKYFQRLRIVREQNDMKQEDIASILNMKYQQYARYETGKQQMPIEHYKTLAEYFDLSIDYLCGISADIKTLSGKPFKLSKNYSIVQNGIIKNSDN